jgi:hypothetical protein
VQQVREVRHTDVKNAQGGIGRQNRPQNLSAINADPRHAVAFAREGVHQRRHVAIGAPDVSFGIANN